MKTERIAELRDYAKKEGPWHSAKGIVIELLDEVERLAHSVEIRDAYAEKLRADLDTARAEERELRARIKNIAQGLLDEVENTRAWRACTGPKVATDTSEFCSAPPSVLRRIEHWMRLFIEAVEEVAVDEPGLPEEALAAIGEAELMIARENERRAADVPKGRMKPSFPAGIIREFEEHERERREEEEAIRADERERIAAWCDAQCDEIDYKESSFKEGMHYAMDIAAQRIRSGKASEGKL